MGKTGLHQLFNQLFESAKNIDLGQKNQRTEGKEVGGRILFFDGIHDATNAFKQIQATNNPQIILSAEKIFIQQDRYLCDPSDKLTIRNLDRSLQYLNDALRAIETVKSASAYSAAETTHPTEHREKHGGVPKDVVHSACNINCNRLDDNNRTPRIDMTEKALFKQRKTNLVSAKEAYISMQKAALGIPKNTK